ncbi:hypothetical protein Lfu02_06040 [Longispora fulva]|uniref:Lipoprotein n=1 Tax=Longispora fulva TaxID=619741 RepID=A0A8J7G892_9ACTN|nr:hypothetical protein [Longispora fulva]MBG6135528.1 hypothetical protein [Longispora fulva]GIG56232.1 hypothetical protein Lfu02_06040 [Longispora fulva]
MRRRLTVLAILASVALAGCTPSPAPAPAPTAATTVTAAPAPAPTGSAAPPATAAPAGYPTEARAYAEAALAAWTGHDTARLAQLNTSELFHSMDLCACYDTHFSHVRCEGAAGSSYCVFRNTYGDELTLQLRNELLGHPQALRGGTFDPTRTPTDAGEYAKAFLEAWQAGNQPRMATLSVGDALTYITTHDTRPDTFTLEKIDGGGTGISPVYVHPPTGPKFLLQLHTSALGHPHAIFGPVDASSY